MGNSPLTVCIHQAWEKQTVQVVLPDGQVLFLPHPLTASMLMEAHPYHFVCQGSPSLLEQRLPMDAKLQSGELYYLLPVPSSHLSLPNNNKAPGAHRPPPPGSPMPGHFQRKVEGKFSNSEKVLQYKPPAPLGGAAEKSPSSFSRVNLKPQQCLINLLVFRQSVASIMPEESLKGTNGTPAAAGAPLVNRNGAVLSGKNSKVDNYYHQPRLSSLLGNNNKSTHKLESRHHQRGGRGRNSKGGWKPQLETISETRPWHDFTTRNYINDFSVSMISSIKALASAPPSPTPINSPSSAASAAAAMISSKTTTPDIGTLFPDLVASGDRPSPSPLPPGSPMNARCPGSPSPMRCPGSPLPVRGPGSSMLIRGPGSPLFIRGPGSPSPMRCPDSPLSLRCPDSPLPMRCSDSPLRRPGSPAIYFGGPPSQRQRFIYSA